MSIESEISVLEAKIQSGINEHSRAQGVHESTMARLKSEHGCDTIEAAEALRTKYEAEAKTHEADAQAHLDTVKAMVNG